MITIILYLIVSFSLDSLISTYISSNLIELSYLTTIYTVISLVIIYNYFENSKKYLLIAIILGFLFDIVYTNTFLLNIIIFLLIYLLLKQLDYLMPNNIFTINIKSLASIYTYHITTYIIILLTHYNSYSLKILGSILLKSTIMTIIYTTISYIFIKKIYYKFSDKKIK